MNPPPGILDFVLSFVERRNKLTSNTYVKYVIFSYQTSYFSNRSSFQLLVCGRECTMVRDME